LTVAHTEPTPNPEAAVWLPTVAHESVEVVCGVIVDW
jgi:hypothetical protein